MSAGPNLGLMNVAVRCCRVILGVFFFKQKTAYEVLRSLVGSEMCIRDRVRRMKHGIKSMGWRFIADRMVKDYAQRFYLPAASATSAET